MPATPEDELEAIVENWSWEKRYSETKRLIEEYKEIEKAFHERLEDEVLVFRLWPFTFERPVTGDFASFAFRIFVTVTFAAGAALIFVPIENAATLGISMVVGSIFALGSYITQWWSVGVQRTYAKRDLIWGEQYRQEVLDLAQRGRDLAAKINAYEAALRPDERRGSTGRPSDDPSA